MPFSHSPSRTRAHSPRSNCHPSVFCLLTSDFSPLGLASASQRTRKGLALAALFSRIPAPLNPQPSPTSQLAISPLKQRLCKSYFFHSAFGHWTLVILWSLVLGHWSFRTSLHPRNTIPKIGAHRCPIRGTERSQPNPPTQSKNRTGDSESPSSAPHRQLFFDGTKPNSLASSFKYQVFTFPTAQRPAPPAPLRSRENAPTPADPARGQ